jgi:uncharacterized membrane protein YccC
MDIAGGLQDVANGFASLPRGVRSAAFALAGLVFTRYAIPLFEDELFMAFVYMAIAVVLFWLAIAPFV